jgi:hypothetical protein
MKITDEFIQKMQQQRNLQSCVTHAVILAQCVRELQADMAEAKLRLGMPDKNEGSE